MDSQDKNSAYEQRGVSSGKEDVYAAIKNLDKGLFPNAFCKILPDLVAGDENFCNIMHADTAGTKSILSYLYWKETGDVSVWKTISQDAIVMNIDDMICAGATSGFVLSSTISRNKYLIPGEVIAAIIQGTTEFIGELNQLGIKCILAGGETADVSDVVRTIDIGFTAFARLAKKDVCTINIQPGDVIVGLASGGQSSYEKEYNSGISCNGLTSARHDLLEKNYSTKYPETFDESVPENLVYSGRSKLNDELPGTSVSIGKALLSPTRTFAPVIKEVLQNHRSDIHGIINVTGGGATKVLHYANELKIYKNNLLPIPPLFQFIQQESGAGWNEMFRVFNCGTRMEIYCNENAAQKIIDTAKTFNVGATVTGHCEKNDVTSVLVEHDGNLYEYEKA